MPPAQNALSSSKVELLSRKDLRDLSVISSGLEILDWILYDTLNVGTSNTKVSFRFFQNSISGSTSIEKTNLEIPGQLPAGYKFVAQKLVFMPRIGGSANDALPLLTSAYVKDMIGVSHRGAAQFFIGTRPYLQCPLVDLIGGALTGWSAASSQDQSYAAPRTIINGELEYAPVVPANFSFSVLVNYDTAPTPVAAIDLQMQIVGKLIRPRQG